MHSVCTMGSVSLSPYSSIVWSVVSESKRLRDRIWAGPAVLFVFYLVNGNAAIQQAAAVAVAIVQRDAEQAGRRQRAIGSDDGERYRIPVVGPSASEGHGVRHRVKGRGRDLRRLEVDAGAG